MGRKLFLARYFIVRRMFSKHMHFRQSCLWNKKYRTFIELKEKVIEAECFVIIKIRTIFCMKH
jgi:hypothetical protein